MIKSSLLLVVVVVGTIASVVSTSSGFVSVAVVRGKNVDSRLSWQKRNEKEAVRCRLRAERSELPDSLSDAAEIAATACIDFWSVTGLRRCRVDLDTSMGDETYTTLKSSTEFMQRFATRLCHQMMLPNASAPDDERPQRLSTVPEEENEEANKEQLSSISPEELDQQEKKKTTTQQQVTVAGNNSDQKSGDILKIYFPDEGSAALARRDWTTLLPSNVEFLSCGARASVVNDDQRLSSKVTIFFCPKASEVESVERLLLAFHPEMPVIFVNPQLVDMGVTGFGMAGRRLRERLIDPLVSVYYLRTYPENVALTRVWPHWFTIWQQDGSSGEYTEIKTLQQLPSNPDVQDIMDYENKERGKEPPDDNSNGFGFLNAIGTFVQGMTRL